MMRSLLLMAAMAVFAAGCSLGSSGSHADSASGHPAPTVHFHGGGVAFSYPAAWSQHRPGYLSTASDGIVDLSTQRLVNPCRRHGNVTTCDLPIGHLMPGGVVVTWTIDELPRPPSELPLPGVHIRVSTPGYCRRIGADESVMARIVTPRHELLWIDACLRAPGLAANERAVRAMLASAT
jgi:hypothetical protein